MKLKLRALLCIIALLLALSITMTSCDLIDYVLDAIEGNSDLNIPSVSLDSIPEFDGSNAYVIINDNVPFFTDEEKVTESYETYGELDSLGRCTVTVACVGRDIMPTEDRGDIGSVKPTGWQSVKYDCVDGSYLYNRCHLIGFQLTGENANKKNLITGTRYLNIEGMLTFEDMVADYVKETGNHVMYRATPIFEGDNLVASGVLMEGWSVEDDGDGICFCIYAYNAQPYVEIDYATGDSWLSGEEPPENNGGTSGGNSSGGEGAQGSTYCVNTSTDKYHLPSCTYATGNNVQTREATAEELEAEGYVACKVCLGD